MLNISINQKIKKSKNQTKMLVLDLIHHWWWQAERWLQYEGVVFFPEVLKLLDDVVTAGTGNTWLYWTVYIQAIQLNNKKTKYFSVITVYFRNFQIANVFNSFKLSSTGNYLILPWYPSYIFQIRRRLVQNSSTRIIVWKWKL